MNPTPRFLVLPTVENDACHGRGREGQTPERGVVEVKSSHEDMQTRAVREQIGRYWTRYRLVLATNLREFVLVSEDATGHEATLESFQLAGSEAAFERRLQTPRVFAREVGTGLSEYLCRALSHRAALVEPKDLAWLLASYARDGLARLEVAGDDFALKAGWGHYGTGDAVMPGQGRVVQRPYTPEERIALGDALPVPGETTFDIYLNGRAYWRNIPIAVSTYRLGGYQVLEKWLSYREHSILDRPLSPEEVQHFTDTARRIGAILVAVGSSGP